MYLFILCYRYFPFTVNISYLNSCFIIKSRIHNQNINTSSLKNLFYPCITGIVISLYVCVCTNKICVLTCQYVRACVFVQIAEEEINELILIKRIICALQLIPTDDGLVLLFIFITKAHKNVIFTQTDLTNLKQISENIENKILKTHMHENGVVMLKGKLKLGIKLIPFQLSRIKDK